LFLIVIAAGLMWRRLRLAGIGLALLFLWSWPLFTWLWSGSLEWFYPAGALPPNDAEAIVVLSSSAVPPGPTVPEPYVGWDTYPRCKYAAWLYLHWRRVPVIASGGRIGKEPFLIARLMRTTLEAEGVPAEAILTEERSTSTYENGLFTAELLRSRNIRKIALVTEAHHMLRSDKVFRKLGIGVAPAPCAFYTAGFELDLRALFPSGQAITVNDNVLHEWVGLLWYKLRGRI